MRRGGIDAARRNTAETVRLWVAWRLPCLVGRGLDPAVAVCPAVPFLRYDRVRSMRRGGIEAARRNTAALDVAGAARCLFCIVGRGLDLRPKGRRCAAVGLRNAPAGADPAAHWFGGRERPPYRARETGNEPGTPRGAHPCREAYMPPLQTPGTAYTNPKRCNKADACGRSPALRAGRERQANG